MILIDNVNILAMKGERVDKGQYVKIEEGAIVAIQSVPFDAPPFAEHINGTGLYLMPGLINMHTHLGDNPDDLQLYLVNGVTTIRNMWGYEQFKPVQWLMGTRVFNHLALKKRIAAGALLGPDIITAGPILDGNPPVFPKYLHLHALRDRQQIEQIIEKQASQGYDFIKIYHAMTIAQFDDVMAAAKHFNIPVAGHVPDSVGAAHAIESGLWTMEHLYGFVNPYHPELNPDRETIKALAHRSAENGVWQCPTLIANERLANMPKRKIYEAERQFQYVPKRQRQGMRFLQKASEGLYAKSGVPGNHTYMATFYEIVKQLKQEGAGILMGTDKAVPYVVAGFSEHLEMAMLLEAGLSRYEVIKAATSDAANCLGLRDNLGTVEVGKRANLILTASNPLADLGAIQSHVGVFKGGIFYSREMCDSMLQAIRLRCGS
jgi:imidazolonepropionase-like amidohydrolase